MNRDNIKVGERYHIQPLFRTGPEFIVTCVGIAPAGIQVQVDPSQLAGQSEHEPVNLVIARTGGAQ